MALRQAASLGLFSFLLIANGAMAWSAPPAATPSKRALTAEDNRALPVAVQKLIPLHEPLGEPKPREWLAAHKERGETYRQYLTVRTVKATPDRRTIWIQPLGEFTNEQRKIVDVTGEFLGIFFQLPVEQSANLSLDVIPKEAQRQNKFTEQTQILSTHVLDKVLKPKLPKDAAVYIAFTATDLWPGEGWNFVFGQASLGDRVGVWSLHRFGDPTADEDAYRLALRRTLKTAAHETGHMFSIPHCVYYRCVMNGSNSLDESDRQRLWLCPQCLAKVCRATGVDPRKRFEQLIEFAKREQMPEEQAFWQKSVETLPKEKE